MAFLVHNLLKRSTMKRFYSLVALCLATGSVAFGGPIQAEKAKNLADKFFGTSQGSKSMNISYRAKAKAPKANATQELYYVINKGNNEGFVVISGDDRTRPILAYSETGSLTEEQIMSNPAMRYIFGEFENQITWAQENLADAPSKSYKALAGGRFTPRSSDIIVQPLLALKKDRKTKRTTPIGWGQEWPFNDLCPTIRMRDHYGNIRNYPTVSGCVATAI